MTPPGEKTPHSDLVFVDGPGVADPGVFAAWFERAAQSSPRVRVRLPVLIEVDRRVGITMGATVVGTSSSRAGFAVELTDRMGIPLAEHVRRHCPADAAYCGLWLEGFPAPASALLTLPGVARAGPVFDVVRVVSAFADGGLAETTVGRVVQPHQPDQ